jgi:Family of unknown function (DUF6526)
MRYAVSERSRFMTAQSYSNHRQIVPMYHQVLLGLLALTLIGSVVNLFLSIGDHERLYSATLLVVLTICVILVAGFCRIFALKAQDRAIRAEENLRHFALTGMLLDARLSMPQIIGLRFASDQEFVAMAKRAAEEKLSRDAIKRAVKQWRADLYRV